MFFPKKNGYLLPTAGIKRMIELPKPGRFSRRQLIPIFDKPAFSRILCSPNEDFGSRNKRSVVSFRGPLQGREYSLWATNRCKMQRKCTNALLLLLPKSSFGEHKIPKYFNHTIRGSEFKEIREKAGLSKMGMSCRRLGRLHQNDDNATVGNSPPFW